MRVSSIMTAKDAGLRLGRSRVIAAFIVRTLTQNARRCKPVELVVQSDVLLIDVNFCTDIDAVVKINHVLVHHTDTSR